MRTIAMLHCERFRSVQSAASATAADAACIRVLVTMLATVDVPHWLKHGEMLSYVSLDTLEHQALVSKATIAKAQRRLIAMGMIVRLTAPELRGRSVVWCINCRAARPAALPQRRQRDAAYRLGDHARPPARRRAHERGG
jgi:hypothetical protein